MPPWTGRLVAGAAEVLLVTLGLALDVDITTREMRWRVTNHSIISFFYNAAVLAIAIGVLVGH